LILRATFLSFQNFLKAAQIDYQTERSNTSFALLCIFLAVI